MLQTVVIAPPAHANPMKPNISTTFSAIKAHFDAANLGGKWQDEPLRYKAKTGEMYLHNPDDGTASSTKGRPRSAAGTDIVKGAIDRELKTWARASACWRTFAQQGKIGSSEQVLASDLPVIANALPVFEAQLDQEKTLRNELANGQRTVTGSTTPASSPTRIRPQGGAGAGDR